MLTLFTIVQFCGLGLVFFSTYVLYICATKAYIYREKTNMKRSYVSKKTHNRSLGFVIIALFINYKYYCLTLLDLGGTIGKVKPKRFRNDQLYIKYCWHLSLEFILILFEILFCGLNVWFYCVENNILPPPNSSTSLNGPGR